MPSDVSRGENTDSPSSIMHQRLRALSVTVGVWDLGWYFVPQTRQSCLNSHRSPYFLSFNYSDRLKPSGKGHFAVESTSISWDLLRSSSWLGFVPTSCSNRADRSGENAKASLLTSSTEEASMEINFRRRLSYRVWQGKVSAQSFCSKQKINFIGFESDHRTCLCRFFWAREARYCN